MGDGGRGVPKSTHDATETDHADQNESYHWTKQNWTEPENDKTCKNLENQQTINSKASNSK